MAYSIFLMLLSGDGELSPGPRRPSDESFSICHSAYNYSKLFLLKAYIVFHKFDIVCLSETHLVSSVALGEANLEIPGYKLVRSDHPSQ